jgi:hypothetical protein
MDGFFRTLVRQVPAQPAAGGGGIDRGNPWRFLRSTKWKKAMDGFFHV